MVDAGLNDDPFAFQQWHVVCALEDVGRNGGYRTRLLGRVLDIESDTVVRGPKGTCLPVLSRFGYLWTTLGTQPQPLFEIAEAAEPDRCTFNAASIGVHASAPRAVENFLDLGHFPFVHPDYLGVEPHTEVLAYDVEVSAEGGVVARHCRFYQPRAAAMSDSGIEVEYEFRVPHPFCALLYKTNPATATRRDAIGLFVQPLDEEHIAAHLFLALLDDVTPRSKIRDFQQTIFAQDKPILESQRPRKLPLDLRAEIPVRADATSTAYRKWLSMRGLRYGVIPVIA